MNAADTVAALVKGAPLLTPARVARLRLLLATPVTDATITTVTPRKSARLRADQAA